MAATNPNPNTMGTDTNAPWIPEVIANESMGLLGSYLNLGKTVSKDSDLQVAKVGQKIHIPRRGVIVAQQKTQHVDAETQQPDADDVEITVDQHWYVRLAEEDFTKAMQQSDALPGYIEDAVIVLAEKIEGQLAAHASEFDNVDVTGSDADRYVKGVQKVRERMSLNKVPQLAQKYGYVHPTVITGLLQANAFIDPKLIPNNRALTEGTVGRVAGFDVFEGQLVESVGSPAWYQNFFYTKNALVLASRSLEIPGAGLGVQATTVQSEAGLSVRVMRAYDTKSMSTIGQIDVLFGTGVNDARQGFVLESQ